MSPSGDKTIVRRPDPLCGAAAAICHRRWAIPVLAELKQARGCKFVTLVNRLGVSRPVLAQTLNFLIRDRLVQRNAGYGHPLRPEYILTQRGGSVGKAALTVRSVLQELDLEDAGLRKWSLAIVIAIGGAPRRFSELRERLGGITDRALSLSLHELCGAGAIERIESGQSGTPEYAIAHSARPLGVVARRFAISLTEM